MSWIHTRLILPMAEPERHAGLAARIRAIRRFEGKSESEQRDEHEQRLRKLLQHAYQTVPFHRKRFDDAGFDPSTARADSPLPLLPMRRDDLRDETRSLLSSAFRTEDLRQAGSSGTTSTPVIFHRDVEALRNKTALTLQLNAWADYHAGDSVMTLWGAHRDLAMAPSWRWRLYEEVLMRRTPAPSGILSGEIMERFRLRYEEHRPKVLYAYSTVLAAFASHLRDKGMRHRPQVLIATAEVMSDENRHLVESVFGVPLFIHYGSRDTGMICAECSMHQGMHFHPWGAHVEFDPIGDTPDGPAYRILVTDLLNYGQPFIRYDTGDCATLANRSCSCGRWYPLVSRILGRVADGLKLRDGSMVPGVSVGNFMSQMGLSFSAVAQVQFIQKTYERIHLRYVVKSPQVPAGEELECICRGIDSMAPSPFQWSLEQVAEIPRERSGKIRLCISDISALDSESDRSSASAAFERQQELVP